MKKAIVIAECGCNHMGNIKIAHQMIDSAVECGVDVVKFQKRTPRELLTPEEYNKPHPSEHNSFGETYGEHREYLEFTIKQHAELIRHCIDVGVIYSCSVWDLTAAKEIITINPKMIKIPSACNLNKPLLDYVVTNYYKEIHISFGMTTASEYIKITQYLDLAIPREQCVLYECTSGYPVPFEDVKLRDIGCGNGYRGCG